MTIFHEILVTPPNSLPPPTYELAGLWSDLSRTMAEAEELLDRAFRLRCEVMEVICMSRELRAVSCHLREPRAVTIHEAKQSLGPKTGSATQETRKSHSERLAMPWPDGLVN